jgi:hypothetical protein
VFKEKEPLPTAKWRYDRMREFRRWKYNPTIPTPTKSNPRNAHVAGSGTVTEINSWLRELP